MMAIHRRIVPVLGPLGALILALGCSGTPDLRERMRPPRLDEISTRQSSRSIDRPTRSVVASPPMWQKVSATEDEARPVEVGARRFWLYALVLLASIISLAELRTRVGHNLPGAMTWMFLAMVQCLLSVSYLAHPRWELVATILSLDLLMFFLFRPKR